MTEEMRQALVGGYITAMDAVATWSKDGTQEEREAGRDICLFLNSLCNDIAPENHALAAVGEIAEMRQSLENI